MVYPRYQPILSKVGVVPRDLQYNIGVPNGVVYHPSLVA
jgi:hypothetical protein